MSTRVVHFDRKSFETLSEIEELSGKLSRDLESQKLMHSVIDSDKDNIKDGKLISKAINQGIGSFTPDLMFQQMVSSFSMTKKLFGATLLREITGYNPEYIQKNLNIPEFKRELKGRIAERINLLKRKDLVDSEGHITEDGYHIASMTLYHEELDRLVPKGMLGERVHNKPSIYGMKGETKNYRRGDKYRNIAFRDSIKKAVRRGHVALQEEDLMTARRQSKGQLCIIYALDASGSMRGKKIEMCKKAGIALAFRAIEEKDNVGLIVFGADIKREVEPCQDFTRLLRTITEVTASHQTNFVETLKKAIEMFDSYGENKHLIMLTDAFPTSGVEPEKETIEAVSMAKANSITISLIGIDLDKRGIELAKKIVEIGEGRFYIANSSEEIDSIVLEDYYSSR
jgi:Mg-chelatase subunit ChlD